MKRLTLRLAVCAAILLFGEVPINAQTPDRQGNQPRGSFGQRGGDQGQRGAGQRRPGGGGQRGGAGQGQRGQGGRPTRVPIVLTEGQLPDTDAHLPDGTPIKVRDLIKGKYTVIKTGCMTCPEFLIAHKELEATAADYEKKGVQFYYIYQSLRHPEREGYVQPQNTKERLMHVAEAKKRLGTKVPWIMDTIDDSFRVAMRTNSNSVFIIGPDSEIVYAADRMNGDGVRRALIDLVGPVENPTSAQDMNFPTIPRFPPTNITNEIRVERPQGLVILKTTPAKPEETYYVKMRAEAEKSVLETGKGDLYLGFFPDPIHDAHWNNLTPGMKYVFELPNGVTIDPPTAVANKGPGDSDTEPRQFKLKVDSNGTPADVKLKIHYYACSPGMCEAKTHEYTIAFEDMNRNSRTYSFNRGQGAPGGTPKPANRQFGPGREGGNRQSPGGGGRGMGPGQGRGGQQAQGRGGAGGQGRGAGTRPGNGQAQGSRGGGPRDRVRPRDIEFNEKFPVGTELPATLKVYNVDRELVPVTSILKNKYTVFVGGCLTCPAYRSSYPEIEAVARDFSDRGVDFFFVYQSLAHPENWGFVQPTSIEDRFAQVAHAEELLQTKIPWLTDPMDNQFKTYRLGTPNSQLVFSKEGKVVHRDSWGRGSSLRESLESLVGKPETMTSVQDLNLPRFARHLAGETLLERKRVEGVAVPLIVKSGGESSSVDALRSNDFNKMNRYVKLRPEADQQLIQTGSGKLYLGFRQDPVLGAKWNNLADPPQYKIITEGNATFSPETGQSPKLDIESDDEPREFLVDVTNWKTDEPITVKVQYFACKKEKGWCTSVQQEFTVELQKDELAGMVNGRTHFPGGGGGRGAGQGGRGAGGGGLGRPGGGQGQRPGGGQRPNGQGN